METNWIEGSISNHLGMQISLGGSAQLDQI